MRAPLVPERTQVAKRGVFVRCVASACSVAVALMLVPSLMHGLAGAATSAGKLVVFVQPSASELARTFERQHLANVRAVAQSLDVPVQVVDVHSGAPAAVAITPLVVYANFRGRSIYQGRFASTDRLRNFIRTARVVPQGAVRLEKSRIPVWRSGRATVAMPIKITDLAGTHAPGHDNERFAAEAFAHISAGLRDFGVVEHVALGRADRLFYADFYPWRSDSGVLHVAVAVFSQFHCETPIFERKDERAISGDWASRADVFARAARAAEAAIAQQLTDAVLGDGFDVVSNAVRAVSWAAVGLALPERPAGAATTTTLNVPTLWMFERAAGAATTDASAPAIVFRFPAPLDHYTGTVEHVRGELRLGAEARPLDASGWVEAATASVHMGAADLDDVIHDVPFLSVERFPTARFELQSLSGDSTPLEFGSLRPFTLTGTYSMRGVSIPVSLPASFEPIVAADGRPRLLVTGSLELRLREPFGMLGADGPQPQSDTVVLVLNLAFEPAEAEVQRN